MASRSPCLATLQAAAALMEAACGRAPTPQAAEQALLCTDLKEVGAACLPDDVNRADSKKLAGPLVLQVRCGAPSL